MHYNCKSVSFDHLHPVPLSPHPHFWWPQIWSVFLWASLFACFIFKYNWPTTLWYFLVYNTVIQYFYIAKKDCSAKFSYHRTIQRCYKLLTIFPMLYISPLWLSYFVTGSLYLLFSPTISLVPSPSPFWQALICSLF